MGEARICKIKAFQIDSNVASGNDQSIRRALGPLARLAGKFDCAVLLVRHLSKSGGKKAIYRGGGSIGVVGVCRSAWLVARDRLDPDRCVLAQVKNNLAIAQPSLLYRVESTPTGPPRLSWLGISADTADQLVSASPGKGTRQKARAFLMSMLQDGPRPARELWEQGQKQGVSELTLRRAKKLLSIRVQRVALDGTHASYWLLPSQVVPRVAGDEDDGKDLEMRLAPLRAAYPAGSPLDED